jgi:hypothetical protein
MSGIGANLPPHLLAKRKRKLEEEASIASVTPSGANKSPSPDAAEKRRRVAGPAMPPAPLDELPSMPASTAEDDDSDDDDGFGPALPSENTPTADHEDNNAGPTDTEASKTKEKLQRDDWMTMPPEQDGLAARMDPSKHRARGFNTSKGAKAPAKKGGDASTWHETPEQKKKRLADELMGITAPSATATRQSEGGKDARRREKDEEAARKVREHNVSLLLARLKWVDICIEANLFYRRRIVGHRLWNSISCGNPTKQRTIQVNALLIAKRILAAVCLVVLSGKTSSISLPASRRSSLEVVIYENRLVGLAYACSNMSSFVLRKDLTE